MNDWFRSWHGAPTDPKWLLIGRKANVPPAMVSAIVWALFDHASQQDDRGSVATFDIETYAVFGGLEEDQVRSVVNALIDKGVIKDGRLSAWEKRQPKREDSSTERVRAYRERKASVTTPDPSNETQCNAAKRGGTLDTDTDTDTDTEKRRGENDVADAAEAAPSKPPARVYADDDPYYLFAQRLGRYILRNNPKHKAIEESQLQKWANDARLMTEADSRLPEDSEKVLDWCQEDPFWSSNILSMGTFRKKWDTLYAQMNRPPRASPNSNGRVFAGDLIADIRRREAMGER